MLCPLSYGAESVTFQSLPSIPSDRSTILYTRYYTRYNQDSGRGV